MRIKYFIYQVLAIALLAFGCMPDDFKMPSWQSELLIPMLDIDLDISDLVLQDSSFKTDDSGLITFIYQQSDTIGTLEELFPIDDISTQFSIPGISGAQPDFKAQTKLFAEQLNIEIGNYAKLEPFTTDTEIILDLKDAFLEATFKSGRLNADLTNAFPFTLNPGMIITLRNASDGIEHVTYEVTTRIEPGESIAIGPIALLEIFIDGEIFIDIDNLSSDGGNNIEIESNNGILFDFSFEDFVYKSASIKKSHLIVPPANLRLPIDLPAGILLSEAKVDNSKLAVKLDNYKSHGINLKFTLLSATQNNIPLEFTLGSSGINIDMKELLIDFSDGVNYNTLRLNVEVDLPQDEYIIIDFDEDYQGTLSLKDIDYGYLKGYFGSINTIIEGEMSTSIFSKVSQGRLLFSDPRFSFTFYNSQGITGSFYDDGDGLFVTGQNQRLFPGESNSIGSSLIDNVYKAPTIMGEVEATSLNINKSTEPEFSKFVGSMPSDIKYRLPLRIGLDDIDMNQYLYDEGVIAYDFLFELPLDIAAENLVIMDTIPQTPSSDVTEIDIKRIALSAKITNYFPLQIDIQNYFLDENHEIIDSLFSTRRNLKPAEISAEGIVTVPREVVFELEITNERLYNINRASYSVPIVRLLTPNGEYAKIYPHHKATIKLTGEINFDVDLNQ